MEHKYPHEAPRLSERAFRERFGPYRSCSLWGARWIGSAILDDGTYVRFDHSLNDYVKEN